ncbi:MAG: serine/threonine protein kinase [Sandaracinaceae bacterium]|nr:serine/threonine protein kinase [Sandaracinaceae bacterium]
MAKPDARLGRVLADRYRLDRILGRGGMGVVYAGVHTWTERPVAVKVLRADRVGSPELLARFFQEARTAATLRHPNVIDVLDMGEDEDRTAFLVMELLEGENLEERLARAGRLSAEDALALLLPVIDALALAHERGIIHRDLKPENVFLSAAHDGRVVPKLLDFGIAKLLEGSSVQTQTGSMLGTPGYMAPEQMRGVGALTPAADVWSMGVILFRALAGRLPYAQDPNPTTMILTMLTTEPPRLVDVAPDAPPSVAAAIDLALKRSPDTRHRDMQELCEALIEGARADGIDVEPPDAALPPGVV